MGMKAFCLVKVWGWWIGCLREVAKVWVALSLVLLTSLKTWPCGQWGWSPMSPDVFGSEMTGSLLFQNWSAKCCNPPSYYGNVLSFFFVAVLQENGMCRFLPEYDKEWLVCWNILFLQQSSWMCVHVCDATSDVHFGGLKVAE